jgi:hypothetical protein
VKSQSVGEIGNVPSAASVRMLVSAARKRGVPVRVLERVSSAFDAFEKFARTQADDRASLVTLVSGSAASPGDAHALSARKAAFRGNAHIWGAKVELMVRTALFFPQAGPAPREDLAMVLGDIGLQRLRESEPLNMVRWFRTGDSPGDQPGVPWPGQGATAPAGDRGVTLLPEFSSRPLPRMVARESVLGGVETELVIPAGRPGAVTIYSEQYRENARPDHPSFYDLRLFVTIPVECVVLEMMVPAGLTDPSTARAVVYGRRAHPEHVYDERTTDLLPQRESAMYLGALEHVAPLPGADRHADAVRHVLGAHGRLGTRFDSYRCRVQYPVLHTLLVLRVDAARR